LDYFQSKTNSASMAVASFALISAIFFRQDNNKIEAIFLIDTEIMQAEKRYIIGNMMVQMVSPGIYCR